MIDADGDQRRKLNVKRKIEDLEDDQKLFMQLVETLRMGDPVANVKDMVKSVQASADFEEAKSILRVHMGEPMKTQTSDIIDDDQETVESSGWHHETHPATSRRRVNMLPVRRLVDTPVVSVPASPWTNVTDDDGFVSHLLSLWVA